MCNAQCYKSYSAVHQCKQLFFCSQASAAAKSKAGRDKSSDSAPAGGRYWRGHWTSQPAAGSHPKVFCGRKIVYKTISIRRLSQHFTGALPAFYYTLCELGPLRRVPWFLNTCPQKNKTTTGSQLRRRNFKSTLEAVNSDMQRKI